MVLDAAKVAQEAQASEHMRQIQEEIAKIKAMHQETARRLGYDVPLAAMRKREEEEEKRRKELQEQFVRQLNCGSTSVASTSSAAFSFSTANALSFEAKKAIDGRSVFVGNVDYSATSEQLEQHFRGCGPIARVTIRGGFAYIEFSEESGKGNALALNDSRFLGRQIKVSEKRTNKPGISLASRTPHGAPGPVRTVVKYAYPGHSSVRDRRGHGFHPY